MSTKNNSIRKKKTIPSFSFFSLLHCDFWLLWLSKKLLGHFFFRCYRFVYIIECTTFSFYIDFFLMYVKVIVADIRHWVLFNHGCFFFLLIYR